MIFSKLYSLEFPLRKKKDYSIAILVLLQSQVKPCLRDMFQQHTHKPRCTKIITFKNRQTYPAYSSMYLQMQCELLHRLVATPSTDLYDWRWIMTHGQCSLNKIKTEISHHVWAKGKCNIYQGPMYMILGAAWKHLQITAPTVFSGRSEESWNLGGREIDGYLPWQCLPTSSKLQINILSFPLTRGGMNTLLLLMAMHIP